LTETKARTYFGDVPFEAMIGKTLTYRDSLQVSVSGIVKEGDIHTDISFADFISFSTIDASWIKETIDLTDWQSTNSASQCFIKANDTLAVHQQLANAGRRYKELNKEVDYYAAYQLQPLSELHFDADLGIFDGAYRTPAHKPTLLILIVVAVLLVVIASVNFVNLETAQAVKRAKEVGIRKVMGSSRTRLVMQFLLQSFIITLCAVLLSIPLSETAVNVFHEFIPAGMTFSLDTTTISFMLAITVVVGMASGLYPAFVLSSFLPARALKNNGHTVGGGMHATYLRKALIVFQFTVAQILIVGTLIVIAQIRFMLNKDLGFTKDAIINIDTPWHERERVTAFQDKLRQLAVIHDLTLCMAPPAASGYSSSVFKVDNGKQIVETNVYRKFGDDNFIPFFGITLLAGRNIGRSDTTREFVINETYMKQLGFRDPKQVIGLQIEIDSAYYPIVGVVKDFHTQSLHEALQPVAISSQKETMGTIGVKLDGRADLQNAVDQIKKAWTEVFPDNEFNHRFMDETIARFYETERRISRLMTTATAIAIILSCLGLFGLASYAATQRTREIGIRKVLGASVNTIIVMLSHDFIKLVALAFVIAAPVAYFMADRWLRDFAFRIDINFGLFVAAAIAATTIALVTVSYHAIRAALANPAESLRSE
jgi:ABC-type antimicrobial peptide transport system permease subunit